MLLILYPLSFVFIYIARRINSQEKHSNFDKFIMLFMFSASNISFIIATLKLVDIFNIKEGSAMAYSLGIPSFVFFIFSIKYSSNVKNSG